MISIFSVLGNYTFDRQECGKFRILVDPFVPLSTSVLFLCVLYRLFSSTENTFLSFLIYIAHDFVHVRFFSLFPYRVSLFFLLFTFVTSFAISSYATTLLAPLFIYRRMASANSLPLILDRMVIVK